MKEIDRQKREQIEYMRQQAQLREREMERQRALAKQADEQRKAEMLDAMRVHDIKLKQAEEQKRLEAVHRQAREREEEERRKKQHREKLSKMELDKKSTILSKIEQKELTL